MRRCTGPSTGVAITDHSDGLGVINEVQTGNPEMLEDPTVRNGTA